MVHVCIYAHATGHHSPQTAVLYQNSRKVVGVQPRYPMRLRPCMRDVWASTLCIFALVTAVRCDCDAAVCQGTCSASANKCICSPGFGGQACEFSIQTVYRKHSQQVYNVPHTHTLRSLDLQTWGAQKDIYRRLAADVGAQLIVEVGVWKGGSSLMFAEWLQEQGHGVVLSVSACSLSGCCCNWNPQTCTAAAAALPCLSLKQSQIVKVLFLTYLSHPPPGR